MKYKIKTKIIRETIYLELYIPPEREVLISTGIKGNQNIGTCSGLVNYLEKQNREIGRMKDAGINLERSKEYLFIQEESRLSYA